MCVCVCRLHLPPAVISDLYKFDIFGLDLSPENMAKKVMLHLYLSKPYYVSPHLYLAWLRMSSNLGLVP